MKNYWRGMNREGVANYLVTKISKYNGLVTLHECVTGNDKAASMAEKNLILSRKLLDYQKKKGIVLTCQECGSRKNDVEVISDLHTSVAICRSCQEKFKKASEEFLKSFIPLN